MDFTITLADDDWDPTRGGWRCPALEIPGAELKQIFVQGKVVDPAQYQVDTKLRLVRWSGLKRPPLAAAHLVLSKALSTQELTARWKKIAIVLPVAGTLAASLIAAEWKPAIFSSSMPSSKEENIVVLNKSNDFLATGGAMRFDGALKSAKREVWFLGTTFYITVDTHRDLIRKKLAEGVDINFIIFDPFGSNAQQVASMLDIGLNELMDQCLLGIRTMIKLADESRGAKFPGELRIRLVNQVAYSRLYLFDPKSNEGTTYFIPQVNQSNSQMLPGFLVKNATAHYATAYFDGVQRTWNGSETLSLSDWRKKHPEVK